MGRIAHRRVTIRPCAHANVGVARFLDLPNSAKARYRLMPSVDLFAVTGAGCWSLRNMAMRHDCLTADGSQLTVSVLSALWGDRYLQTRWCTMPMGPRTVKPHWCSVQTRRITNSCIGAWRLGPQEETPTPCSSVAIANSPNPWTSSTRIARAQLVATGPVGHAIN